MTTCVDCGSPPPRRGLARAGDATWRCVARDECALRAELSLLRAAVLEIAELARTTEGEDTGEFLAYRLREAVGK